MPSDPAFTTGKRSNALDLQFEPLSAFPEIFYRFRERIYEAVIRFAQVPVNSNSLIFASVVSAILVIAS